VRSYRVDASWVFVKGVEGSVSADRVLSSALNELPGPALQTRARANLSPGSRALKMYSSRATTSGQTAFFAPRRCAGLGPDLRNSIPEG
jgi:hypothetical protein